MQLSTDRNLNTPENQSQTTKKHQRSTEMTWQKLLEEVLGHFLAATNGDRPQNAKTNSDRPPNRLREIIETEELWSCLLPSWRSLKDLSLWICNHNEKRGSRKIRKGPLCRLLAGLHCMFTQRSPHFALCPH